MIVAPAMNTLMWNNPFTKQQLSKLETMFTAKFHIIEPISKKLMCNDVGKGAMATPKSIVETTYKVLNNKLADRKNAININQTMMAAALFFALAFAFRSGNRNAEAKNNKASFFDF